MATYDILIKNGTVFDGKGNPPIIADVGIFAGRTKEVGDLSNESGEIEIDATGKYVCPGFIDLTNHSDTHWKLFNAPSQESMVRQGVTTIFGGSCGVSLAPLLGSKGIEPIEKWINLSQININWQSMGEYLDLMEKQKLGLNYGAFVGYNTLRQAVIGDDTREATEEEMKTISLLLDGAIKDGAWGLSTNLGYYQKRYLRDTEILEAMKVVAKNNALSKHHLEDEGKNILPAVSRLIQVARDSGARLNISHLKAVGRGAWGFFPTVLELIKKTESENLRVTCDFSPFDTTGSTLYALLPSWAREMDRNKLLEALKNKESKERKDLLLYFKDLTLHYDRIVVASGIDRFSHIGKTLENIIQSSELPGEEVVLDLLEISNLQISIFNKAVLEENIKRVAQEKYSAICSDGIGYSGEVNIKKEFPHPRSYGAFPRAFSFLVKDGGVLKWEEAINKMTSLPASIVGLKDRGCIEKNFWADVVVFDPQKIKEKGDMENPAQFPEGMEEVIINGKQIFSNGAMTGNLSGMILRKKHA